MIANVTFNKFESQLFVIIVLEFDHQLVIVKAFNFIAFSFGKLLKPVFIVVIRIHAMVFLHEIDDQFVSLRLILKHFFPNSFLVILYLLHLHVRECIIIEIFFITTIEFFLKFFEQLLLLALYRQLFDFRDLMPSFSAFEQILILVSIAYVYFFVFKGNRHDLIRLDLLVAFDRIIELGRYSANSFGKFCHALSSSFVELLIVRDLEVIKSACV